MKLMQAFKDMTIRKRFTASTLAVVVVVMSFFGIIKLQFTINSIMDDLNMKLETITNLAAVGLSDPLWVFNSDGVSAIANALFQDIEISSVEVKTVVGDILYSHQNTGIDHQESAIFKKTTSVVRGDEVLGEVTLGITNYYRLRQIGNEIRNTIFSIAIMVVVLFIAIAGISKMVTKPIHDLSLGTEEIARGNLTKRLVIASHDEIGALAGKFNIMAEKLHNIMKEREKVVEKLVVSERELMKIRDHLAEEVEKQTNELSAANQELLAINDELVDTLDKLKSTQSQLVQSERMAALGGMVAGIAHEINTPVGIGVTGASYLEMQVDSLERKFNENALRKQDMVEYFTETKEAITGISKNLKRADQLIKSFKLVCTDQAHDEKRIFNMKEYLDALILSLNPLFKKKAIHLTYSCSEDLELNSYPAGFAQIITNFVTNSIKHGYGPEESGEIRLEVSQQDDTLLMLYWDDGMGMDSAVSEKIYEPFYTTKRGAGGGTGLGLHLVYNIVTERLKGTIQCISKPGGGTRFEVRVPIGVTAKVGGHIPRQKEY